jgi:hypothetical protein
VRRQVAAAGAQRAPLAGEHELRADAVGRRREEAPVTERVEPGERAETRGACRLDRRPQPADDRVGGPERDARSLGRESTRGAG